MSNRYPIVTSKSFGTHERSHRAGGAGLTLLGGGIADTSDMAINADNAVKWSMGPHTPGSPAPDPGSEGFPFSNITHDKMLDPLAVGSHDLTIKFTATAGGVDSSSSGPAGTVV